MSATQDFPRLLSRAYLCLVLPCTLVMALCIAPFNAPDETAHFLRAATIARGTWIPQVAPDRTSAGGFVDANVAAFISDQWTQLEISLIGSRKADMARIADAQPRHPIGRDLYVGHSNTALYSPFLYAVPAASMMMAQAMGLPLIAWLYLCRISNALFAGILILWAIRRADDAAPAAFVLACLPMSTFLMATLSTDALLVPLAILFAALAARMMGTQEWRRSDSMGLSGAAFIMGVGKIAYLPLCLLPFFLAWRQGGRASPQLRSFALLGLFSILCWIGWAWVVHDKVFSIRPGVLIDPFGQLLWIVTYPGDFLSACLATLQGQGMDMLRGMIGSPLGWFDITLPGVLLGGWGMALFLAARFAPAPARRDPIAMGGVMVAILAQAAAIFLLLYLQYNPVGAARIDGIQGRYFLPPLALLACTLFKRRAAAAGRRSLVVAPCLLGVLTTLIYVCHRYWLVPSA